MMFNRKWIVFKSLREPEYLPEAAPCWFDSRWLLDSSALQTAGNEANTLRVDENDRHILIKNLQTSVSLKKRQTYIHLVRHPGVK